MSTALLVSIGEWTNRTLTLPLVVFFPTSRCNSRCVSCDWWRSGGEGDLSVSEVASIAAALPRLGTRVVLFSGGEPLLRPEMFEMAWLFEREGMRLHLHTSGILLERSAEKVARTFSRVIVSLDAADELQYQAIRGVNALRALERGVARVRKHRRDLPIHARTTLHRRNFRQLPRIVEHARAMGLDGISFLAADLSSGAFGRSPGTQASDLGLERHEVAEFAEIVERTIMDRPEDFASGFIAESPAKLRRLPRHYAARAGMAPFEPAPCNAPSVSVVIEADGRVRPCFFHAHIGSVRETPIAEIVSRNLAAFRAAWRREDDAVCERCVCSMRTTWRSAPWL